MNKRVAFLVIVIFSVFLSYSCSEGVVQKSLIGSWNVEEIHWITPDTTYVIKEAQPGYLMILPRRYAFMWTPTKSARIPFNKLSYPTDTEIKSGFRSIVFNSGTYQIKDSIFKLTADIAKVPGFEGGKQHFVFHKTGDTLRFEMIDETYPDGTKPDWYGKLKTLFILSKINY